jgi:hypothetical protein
LNVCVIISFLHILCLFTEMEELMLSQLVFSMGFSDQKLSYALFISPTYATCPAHIILLNVITLKIFCEKSYLLMGKSFLTATVFYNVNHCISRYSLFLFPSEVIITLSCFLWTRISVWEVWEGYTPIMNNFIRAT